MASAAVQPVAAEYVLVWLWLTLAENKLGRGMKAQRWADEIRNPNAQIRRNFNERI